MTEGYYDPHPRYLLERPLCVIGFMGAGAARTARALASRAGLPFQDLDRIVEHVAGMSRARLMVSRGPERLRDTEREQLERVPASVTY
ncbi:MAG: hypothetical protein OXT09_15630 [Myxococcales bacterium]|nr:hypothetical protein [Myxococcales bacterium]